MKKPDIDYRFSLFQENAAPCTTPLIETLRRIRRDGSIAAAAAGMGRSYRHLWDELRGWEEEFGGALVERGRGRKGTLTPFAQRLLSAETEVQAKYGRYLALMRADLQRVFAEAANGALPLVRLCGCADNAVLMLREEALGRRILVDIDFNSSLKGLEDLVAGRADVAGFNFAVGSDRGGDVPKAFRRFFEDSDLLMIGFAVRIQGLATAAGNPLGLNSLLDVSLKKARYANRNPGSGTRMLADRLLRASGLSSSDIVGYDKECGSHRLVAATVAAGNADAGLCLQDVAESLGIGFVPLAKEAYYFACRREFLGTAVGQGFLALLRDGAWKEKAGSLSGYSFSICARLLN